MRRKNKGVSPVIGVLLLLGVTVAFVALTSNVLFSTFETSASPETDIEITHTDDGSQFSVQMRIIRNENIDQYTVVNNQGDCTAFDPEEIIEPGDVGEIPEGENTESCSGADDIDQIESGDNLSFRGSIGADTFVLETYRLPE